MSDSTYIASDLELTGVFNAPGQTVVIAGQFEGEMTAGSVEITSNAVFVGLVRASEIIVAGRFNGVLETDQLTVSEDAVIVGELVTHALSVDAGADISGTVRRKPVHPTHLQAEQEYHHKFQLSECSRRKKPMSVSYYMFAEQLHRGKPARCHGHSLRHGLITGFVFQQVVDLQGHFFDCLCAQKFVSCPRY